MGIALLLLINLLHAGAPTFMKIAACETDPTVIVWMRHTLAFGVVACILGCSARAAVPRFRWAEWGRVALGAVLAFTIASLLQIASVRRSSASAGAMIVAMEPVAMIVLAVLVLRERLRSGQLLGATVALIGFAILSWNGRAVWQGNLLYLLAVVCEAALPIVLKPLLRTHAPQQIGCGCLLLASVYLLPFQSELFTSPWPQLSWRAWGAIAYLGIACSACGTLLWLLSLRYYSISTIAVSWFLQPVCGIAIACALLGETLSLRSGLGGGLILAAVAMLCWSERRRASPASMHAPVFADVHRFHDPRHLGLPRLLPAFRHHEPHRSHTDEAHVGS